MHARRPLSLLALLVSLLLLGGADGCPLSIGTPSDTSSAGGGGSSGGASTTLDVGGAGGAYWEVSFGEELHLLVEDGGEEHSVSAGIDDGPVAIGGAVVDLGTLCRSSEVLCPDGVLPSTTAIVQPSSDLSVVYVGFNREGPLAAWKDEVGLQGTLDGADLEVPLATHAASSSAAHDLCSTRSGSALVATASASASSASTDKAADVLDGRVRLVYSGDCASLAGGSVIDSSALLSLDLDFSARRVK